MNIVMRYIMAVGASMAVANAWAWTFSGRITDAEGLPLCGVSVTSVETQIGTITDTDGRFGLDISADTAHVDVSMVGYSEQHYMVTEQSPYMRIKMREEAEVMDEFATVAQRKLVQPKVYLDVTNTRHVPAALSGGVEALLQTQSGVVATNELSNQYSVRGGSYDENAVYVNGIEVFRPQLVRSAQQEGLSFVNMDMVGDVAFSSGGFSAEYGDKMSSILDITYKVPERKFEGSVSGSFLGASAYVGSHVGKFSQMHGFRYKNSSYLFKQMETDGDYMTRFLDYQTLMTYDFTPKVRLSFLGNISGNTYDFIPTRRETKFGTALNTMAMVVDFEGGERDHYQNFFGNLSLRIKPNNRLSLEFLTTAYTSDERVNYDIIGEYWIGQSVDGSTAAIDTKDGVGRYHEHARDKLTTSIFNYQAKAAYKVSASNTVSGAITYQQERINDFASEWEMRDSAGYSMPHHNDLLAVYSNLSSDNEISSSRVIWFVQDEARHEGERGILNWSIGLRGNYWNFNDEHDVSVRASLAFFPARVPNWGFRLAGGTYYQSPFYKELKDTVIADNGNVDVLINRDIKSPRSRQVIISADRYFTAWKRPFKFTAEVYGKYLDRIIPYKMDNVKIIYQGENKGDGYVVGGDFKVGGELVPGTDSWISLGLMRARENIYGDGVGYIDATNARTYNVALFFQDQFPNVDQLKLNLKMNFADGFRFGKPNTERKDDVFKSPPYRRVDIGLTYALVQGRDKLMTKGFLRHLRGISLTLDCLNLFGIENVSSVYWVTNASGAEYGVPNNLTKRQINLCLMVDF